ncbi:Peptidase M13 family protein, partial [hydrothermal vent metagenome]
MKHILLSGAAALALAACGEKASQSSQTGTGEETAKTAEVSTAPELGAWGVETDNIDPAVDPGDDFYQYAGGKWLDSFEIPDEFPSYGAFTVLFERSETRVRKIIEDAASGSAADGSVEKKIGDFFASYVDVDAINAKGLDPIAGDLAKVAALETHEDVARLMADPALGANTFVGIFVGVDSKQPDRYITYMSQAGLGLPNRDYYLDEKFADKRAKYKDYITEMLTLASVEDPAAKAQAIYDVELRMAEVHWEPAKRRNRDLTYNLKTREELAAYAPGAPWDVFLNTSGLGAETEFVVREDDAIQNLAAIFGETPVATWRDYLQFHFLRSNAAILPSAFDDVTFAFYGTELRGTPKQRERWKRGVAAVNGALGEAVGQVYVERYFPPESKTQMEALVANLRIALDERLKTLPWMSEETKAAAHEKLEMFTPKIGYPEKWEDYADFAVVRGDAYSNAKSANAFAWND